MRGLIAPALVHSRDLSIITSDMELALMFALTDYDKRRHEQHREGTYEFFAKILWPVTLIQAGPENYIGIDRMKYFFDLQFKITEFLSPTSAILPRLEQSYDDLQTRLELLTQLEKEIDVTPKKDLTIKGIIGPEILRGLVPLIKLATDKTIISPTLDPIISTDDLIDIANQYNQTLRNIEETISKWHSLQTKIKRKLEKWRSSYLDAEFSSAKEQIAEKSKELNKKILDNIWSCRSEIDYLFHWAILGQALNLVIPFTEIWIPLYLAKIILPNKTIKFLVSPPSIFSEEIKANRWVPIDAFHYSFYTNLKERIESALETHSQLTQKIETICIAQNLFLKEEANTLIRRGFNRIQEKKVIENRYVEALQVEWQNVSQNLEKRQK